MKPLLLALFLFSGLLYSEENPDTRAPDGSPATSDQAADFALHLMEKLSIVGEIKAFYKTGFQKLVRLNPAEEEKKAGVGYKYVLSTFVADKEQPNTLTVLLKNTGEPVYDDKDDKGVVSDIKNEKREAPTWPNKRWHASALTRQALHVIIDNRDKKESFLPYKNDFHSATLKKESQDKTTTAVVDIRSNKETKLIRIKLEATSGKVLSAEAVDP